MDEFVRGIAARLRDAFDPEVMGGALAAFVANLIVGLLTFAAFYLLWRLLDRGLRGLIRRSDVDATSASFLETALKYVVLVIGAVQALAVAGINTAAVIASLGLAGLTVGFAARDALSNLISGLLIFWDRPFVIGDLVEVEGDYGRVDRITLRSTRVVTVDGKMLAVPNSTIINTTVASYTNFPHLRLDIAVTVGVEEDLDRVRAVLLGLVADDPVFLPEPPPRMVVTALNDYNVEVQLQAWLSDEREHIPQRFALRERVFKALTAAGVEMPFETLQLAPVTVETHAAQGDGATR
ncbi:MAG: mechanosensitive ion channel family protein [Rubricoccaceae bacterium]|nr:mechanosensitive ion channel family protein [Rubricoccaceae bacterium]